MAAGVNTPQTLRKAIGALKDSTKVGLAKVNSEYKGIDIAIVKATKHDEAMPKEKHIRKIFSALSASSPRMDVAYCIHRLTKRLKKTSKWTVALKAMIVIHRAMKEIDPSFRGELFNYGQGRGPMLNLYHFRDDSSPNAWDCSAWIRSYACYLEERLECICIFDYDIDQDYPTIRNLETPELLNHLPALQEVLFRLVACRPEGAALHTPLVHYALIMVAADSAGLSMAISGGIHNLVDKYFDMQRKDAIKALEIYRRSGNQAKSLGQYYDICRIMPSARGQNFVSIEQPPDSFLSSMDAYVTDTANDLPINDNKNATLKALPAPEVDEVEWKLDPCITSSDTLKNQHNETAPTVEIADLLCWDDFTEETPGQDESNHLALAIVTHDNALDGINSTSQSTGWELELVTAPTSGGAVYEETKLVGKLDNLYNDALSGKTSNGTQVPGQVASNPFEFEFYNCESFHATSSMSPSNSTQIVPVVQEQAVFPIQDHQEQQPNVTSYDSANPFGNPFLDPSFSFKSVQPQSS
ncbi:hypothetical protein K2173_017435 [Erythroxylum novogranatense]|uniref:ENTH domain-containing protein n=1 Tax=Erythroxylum novogranatense TaxID=1862640 RepID=A0AAV8TKK7_9ROSI|nr:hypothetical protein K2173_017435 [Erythroxylum novogranatense]